MDEVARMLSGEKRGDSFLQGKPMASGLAIGTVMLLDPLAEREAVPDRPVRDIAAEESRFMSAIVAVQEELRDGTMRVAADVRALFEVHAMLLGSDDLVSDTLARIRSGNWAPGAWRDTIAKYARVFEQMEDPYLRKGVEDIRPIGQSVLHQLEAESTESRQYPRHCILVGDSVSIMVISAVPAAQLAGAIRCVLLMRVPAFDHVVAEAPVMFSAGIEDKYQAVRFRMLVDETRQHFGLIVFI